MRRDPMTHSVFVALVALALVACGGATATPGATSVATSPTSAGTASPTAGETPAATEEPTEEPTEQPTSEDPTAPPDRTPVAGVGGEDLLALLPEQIGGGPVEYTVLDAEGVERLQEQGISLNIDQVLSATGKAPQDFSGVFGTGSASLVAVYRVAGTSQEQLRTALLSTLTGQAAGTPTDMSLGGKSVVFVPLVEGQETGSYVYFRGDTAFTIFGERAHAEEFFSQLP